MLVNSLPSKNSLHAELDSFLFESGLIFQAAPEIFMHWARWALVAIKKTEKFRKCFEELCFSYPEYVYSDNYFDMTTDQQVEWASLQNFDLKFADNERAKFEEMYYGSSLLKDMSDQASKKKYLDYVSGSTFLLLDSGIQRDLIVSGRVTLDDLYKQGELFAWANTADLSCESLASLFPNNVVEQEINTVNGFFRSLLLYDIFDIKIPTEIINKYWLYPEAPDFSKKAVFRGFQIFIREIFDRNIRFPEDEKICFSSDFLRSPTGLRFLGQIGTKEAAHFVAMDYAQAWVLVDLEIVAAAGGFVEVDFMSIYPWREVIKRIKENNPEVIEALLKGSEKSFEQMIVAYQSEKVESKEITVMDVPIIPAFSINKKEYFRRCFEYYLELLKEE